MPRNGVQMSAGNGLTPGVEVVPLRAALAKFARLLDEFSNNLRVWRDAVGGGYEQRWKELQGDQSASLIRTLDEFLLEVFHRHLLFIRSLRDLYMSEVYHAAESDPFAVSEQVNRFRSKADLKLLYLEDQIQQLKMRLGQAVAGADEDLFEIPVRVQPAAEPAPGAEPIALVEQPPVHVFEAAGGSHAAPEPSFAEEKFTDVDYPSPKSRERQVVQGLSIAELERMTEQLRRIHHSGSDLQIKTSKGVETISLQYFAVPNGADGSIAMLDLEKFVSSQRLALNGALKMTENLYRAGDEARRKAIFKRIKDFIRGLYENARAVIEPQGQRLLPYTGSRITRDVLLNFEAKLRMSEWFSANDVDEFRGLFNTRLEWPLTELFDDPDERRKYLESIVFAADN